MHKLSRSRSIKSAFTLFLVGLAWSCSDRKDSELKTFNPHNEEQLVEIYVRSNEFNDFSVMDEYQLAGTAAYQYTQAIQAMSENPEQWQRFSRKAERFSKVLQKRIDAGKVQISTRPPNSYLKDFQNHEPTRQPTP